MRDRSYKGLGILLVVFSIISVGIIAFLTFGNGDLIENVRSSSVSSTVLFCLISILVILGGIKMKNKYPDYYKYQIISGGILLVGIIVLDIIPRIMHSI